MPPLEMLPIGSMEGGIRGVHRHCVATSALVDGLLHHMVPPSGTAPLLHAEPRRDLFVRDAMLVLAIGAHGLEVASGGADYSYVVVEPVLLMESDSTQVVAFGLKVLL